MNVLKCILVQKVGCLKYKFLYRVHSSIWHFSKIWFHRLECHLRFFFLVSNTLSDLYRSLLVHMFIFKLSICIAFQNVTGRYNFVLYASRHPERSSSRPHLPAYLLFWIFTFSSETVRSGSAPLCYTEVCGLLLLLYKMLTRHHVLLFLHFLFLFSSYFFILVYFIAYITVGIV